MLLSEIKQAIGTIAQVTGDDALDIRHLLRLQASPRPRRTR